MAFLDLAGLTRFKNKLEDLFAKKSDTVLTTTLSRGRKANTTTGTASFAFGNDVTASGNYSHAEGYETIAKYEYSHVSGKYNDNGIVYYDEGFSAFTYRSIVQNGSNVNYRYAYDVGEKVYLTNNEQKTYYVCIKQLNTLVSSPISYDSPSSPANDTEHWENVTNDISLMFLEIVGNGTSDNARSNARALDSNGNEYLKGTLKVGCNSDSSGGTEVAVKVDTVLTTTLSRGRKANTTIGTGSFAFGNDVEASGTCSHAEGYSTEALGSHSHAEGTCTYVRGSNCFVFGRYNVKDITEWTADTSYAVGDNVYKVRRMEIGGTYVNVIYFYRCITANSDSTFDSSKWEGVDGDKYIEIVGNGSSSSRSNARALDWDGNEYLNGDLFIKCDSNSANGISVNNMKISKVYLSSVSSLPKTYSVPGLLDTHEVIKSILSVPEAQGSDWTVTTSTDSLTISGTFIGTSPTSITLYFAIPNSVTATDVSS